MAGATLDASTMIRWLTEAECAIVAQADHLSALDAALGDGDHGTNMSRGFAAVGKALAAEHDGTPGYLLTLAGKTLIATIGGASGALWGLALRRAGRALGDARTFDGHALSSAIDEMVSAVVDLGDAAPGDKTMLDALQPAADTMRATLSGGGRIEEAVAAAAAAARAGADATAAMVARKGRASFLGERSLGHQDASANSTAIVFDALRRAVERG